MKIEILGEGCSKCVEAKKSVLKAVAELNIDADIESTMDPEVIANYHALSLPVLVIDGVPQPVGSRM
nr:thioredoxin family protein [Burkholderiales bacterium]